MKTKDANLAKAFEWLAVVLESMPPYVVGTAQERAKPARSHLQATPEEIAHQDMVRAVLAKKHPKEAAELDRFIADHQRRLAEGLPLLSQTEFTTGCSQDPAEIIAATVAAALGVKTCLGR